MFLLSSHLPNLSASLFQLAPAACMKTESTGAASPSAQSLTSHFLSDGQL